MCFLFLMGILGLTQLKSTLYPELDPRLIQIQVAYPGAAPAEIEEGIITKIEQKLKGLDGIERITSVSSENIGWISIELLKGFDANQILQKVRNRVDQINAFPLNMEQPIISKAEFLSFAINFAVSGHVALPQLKAIAQEIEEELRQVDGISHIELSGFPAEEIEISFQEKDLRKYGLTFQQVLSVIQANNIETTGGKIKTSEEELLIRARNKKYYAKDLKHIVIKINPSGGKVYLHQVATIKDQWEDTPNRTYLDGNPAALFTIRNTIREDVLKITESVRQYIGHYNQQNVTTQITIINDGSEELTERIKLLVENGAVGFLLVLLILTLFLNWRLAFWVGLSIPICFAGLAMVIGYFGVTINLFSLFGMIIVIGILVDDGIVIAENIYQKHEAGFPPEEAALEGTIEMFPAIFGAILTSIIGFSAAFFVDGTMGQFAIDLTIVVIVCLLFSLLECLLILPAHIAHSQALRKKANTPNLILKGFNGLMNGLRDNIYQPILKFTIHFPFPMLAISLVSMIITIGAYQGGVIKETFFPNMPSERFFVDLKMPAGTNASVTEEVMLTIETAAKTLNESFEAGKFGVKKNIFTHYVRSVGPASNQGRLIVYLIPTEERGEFTARDLSGLLRDEVGIIYEVDQLQYWVESGFGKPVDISVLSSNYEALELATSEITTALKRIEDLRDITADNVKGLKEINIELKPKAHHLGFTLAEVIQQVRLGFFGGEVQRLQRGEDEVKVWVRYESKNRTNLQDLANMRIQNTDGLSVALSELAHFTPSLGVTTIFHHNGARMIGIGAEIANSKVSVSRVMANISQDIIPQILAKYPSVIISYNGEQREQAKTLASIKVSISIVLLIIFFLMILMFKSIGQALVVFIIMPFGFVGIGLGHYLMDLPISMISLLGLGALLGILVNDALVFITTFNAKLKSGQAFQAALYETGLIRFRPIILTSVTTVVGLAPILLEKSLGAQMLIPMAVSVAFGLLIVTIIILVLVPALLQIENNIKNYSLSIWEGKFSALDVADNTFIKKNYNFFIISIGGLISLLAFVGLFYAIWYLVSFLI